MGSIQKTNDIRIAKPFESYDLEKSFTILGYFATGSGFGHPSEPVPVDSFFL